MTQTAAEIPGTLATLPTATVKSQPDGFGSVQYIVTFPNGRGASIISHKFSHGVELAVLDGGGKLDYSTPVTDDVLGWLTPADLRGALTEIAALPAEGEGRV